MCTCEALSLQTVAHEASLNYKFSVLKVQRGLIHTCFSVDQGLVLIKNPITALTLANSIAGLIELCSLH